MDKVKEHCCPICKKTAKHEGNKYWPFCSKRCADIDLGHWLTESYTVPAVELDDNEIEQLMEAKENPDNN